MYCIDEEEESRETERFWTIFNQTYNFRNNETFDAFYAFSSKYDDYDTVVTTDLEWTKESSNLLSN